MKLKFNINQLDIISQTAVTLRRRCKAYQYKELLKRTYEIDIPEIKESGFAVIEISGDKEVLQPNGIPVKFSYRDAYFSFLGLVIL